MYEETVALLDPQGAQIAVQAVAGVNGQGDRGVLVGCGGMKPTRNTAEKPTATWAQRGARDQAGV